MNKLRHILLIKSPVSKEIEERIWFFIKWIDGNYKALHRKEQNLYMEIQKVEKALEKRSHKNNHHPSAATDLFASIAVSQNIILETRKSEENNQYLRGLHNKRISLTQICEKLNEDRRSLIKILKV
jgi:hypothetical protein